MMPPDNSDDIGEIIECVDRSSPDPWSSAKAFQRSAPLEQRRSSGGKAR